MKRRSLIGLIIILIGVFYLTGLTFAAEKKDAEIEVISKIVTIHPSEGVRIITLTSNVGTTVVWLNRDRSPVEILFLDKKVTLACSSPVNFFVGKGGAYESAKIPFGGTASLCFTEKERYEYVVKSSRTFYDQRLAREHRGDVWIK